MSLEKQLNCALKRSSRTCSLRANKCFIGAENKIELICLTYVFQYLTNQRKIYDDALQMLTANPGLSNCYIQIFFDNRCINASLQKSLFSSNKKK